jgi:hypothetical protein
MQNPQCGADDERLTALSCRKSVDLSIDVVGESDGRVIWRLWDDSRGQVIGAYATEAAAHAIAEIAIMASACADGATAVRRDLVSAVRRLASEANEPYWFLLSYDAWPVNEIFAEAQQLELVIAAKEEQQ